MTQTLTKPVTYEEFIEWYPDDEKRYELHNGVIVEMALANLAQLRSISLSELMETLGIQPVTYVK